MNDHVRGGSSATVPPRELAINTHTHGRWADIQVTHQNSRLPPPNNAVVPDPRIQQHDRISNLPVYSVAVLTLLVVIEESPCGSYFVYVFLLLSACASLGNVLWLTYCTITPGSNEVRG